MLKIKNKTTSSSEELIEIGIEFSQMLKPKDIVILNGPLGAGKTTFVKGIAKGLGIKKNIKSPTFTIVKEYEQKLCHIDAYRINDEDIGLEHYIDNNYIICIEWSDNIIKYIPEKKYQINIDYKNDGRLIEILKVENE